jgi:hypothetical protein
MKPVYTQRNKTLPSALQYSFSEPMRNRILSHFRLLADAHLVDLPSMLMSVAKQCSLAYGGIHHRGTFQHANPIDAVVEHFSICPDDMVIDFIEMCFQSRAYQAGQDGVDVINGLFRSEGIGWEFSRYVVRRIDLPDGSYQIKIDYPEAIKKTNEVLHTEVVKPVLDLLSGSQWKAANDHLLLAHRNARDGDFRGAITECSAALETVLKTICQAKGWKYTPDKDVLSQLVQLCNDKGLFFPFYVEIIKNCGTIRNKLGGHGKEPKGGLEPELAHVEHMIHLTSANIVFLARLAGMK